MAINNVSFGINLHNFVAIKIDALSQSKRTEKQTEKAKSNAPKNCKMNGKPISQINREFPFPFDTQSQTQNPKTKEKK